MPPRQHALRYIKLSEFIELQKKRIGLNVALSLPSESRSADVGAAYTQKPPHHRSQTIKVNDMAKNERT